VAREKSAVAREGCDEFANASGGIPKSAAEFLAPGWTEPGLIRATG